MRANGRAEVDRVDVATKCAGRRAELRVNEGRFVEKGDIELHKDLGTERLVRHFWILITVI